MKSWRGRTCPTPPSVSLSSSLSVVLVPVACILNDGLMRRHESGLRGLPGQFEHSVRDQFFHDAFILAPRFHPNRVGVVRGHPLHVDRRGEVFFAGLRCDRQESGSALDVLAHVQIVVPRRDEHCREVLHLSKSLRCHCFLLISPRRSVRRAVFQVYHTLQGTRTSGCPPALFPVLRPLLHLLRC